jgi:hypothetical protein
VSAQSDREAFRHRTIAEINHVVTAQERAFRLCVRVEGNDQWGIYEHPHAITE